MSFSKIAGVALVAAGLLGLAYGGFTLTKDSHDARIGSLELSVKDTRRVNVPVWLGAAAVLVGGILVWIPRKA